MLNRKSHWQNVYKNKSPLEVSWYQPEPRLSLALIKEAKAARNEAVIDIGGGASNLVDHLLQVGYSNVSVLDISGNALAKAKERLGDLADKVHWYESDVTAFVPPTSYTIWHDRAVFHFLTDAADQASYVEVLKQALKPNGSLIIATFATDGPEKCSGLNIVQYDKAKMQAILGEGFELMAECHEIHMTPAKKEQKFVFFHFIRRS